MKQFLRSSFYRLKPSVFLVGLIMFLVPIVGRGQMLIPSSSAVTQNFDGIGTNTTASLPTGFKFGLGSGPTYSASGNYTQTSVALCAASAASSGGTYNFGLNGTCSDRAIGFLSSGSYSSPRHIMLQVKNTTGSTIQDLLITFDYEKYRYGSRAFNWTFFISTDGSTWTSNTSGDQSYIADGGNTVVNPPTSISKSVTLNGITLANNDIIYFRWTYTGVGGDTNAQGLAFDNLVLTPTLASTGLTPTLTLNPTTIPDFGSTSVNTTTTAQNFTVTGTDLTAGVTISTSNPDFKISTSSTGPFDVADILLTAAAVSTATPIYVVFNPTTAGSKTGTLTVTSTGATNKTVSVSGTATSPPVVPTLTLTTPSGVTATAATIGATVNDGGSAITNRGFYYGTSPAPIGNDIPSGTGNLVMSANLSNLSPNTLYYYRAYATNAIGTSYSSDGNFTTATIAPLATSALSILYNGFTANWNTVSGGTKYTLEISATNTFGSILQTINNITSTSQAVTALTANTTYYYRVRAVNSEGLISENSNVVSLTTALPPFLENFENDVKTSYAAGTVNLVTGSWTLSNTLIGTLANDVKNGTKSARLQTGGIIEMNFDKTSGLGEVTVLHARYGSDVAGSWKLEASTDGGVTWIQYGTTVNTTTTSFTSTTITVNEPGTGRIRIVGLTGNRLSFDDILITDYNSTAPYIKNVTFDAIPVCAGETFNVSFTQANIAAGTTFTAELSDNTGSFASATSIGLGTSNTILVTVPNTVSGSGYKIRVTGGTATSAAVNAPTFNAMPSTTLNTTISPVGAQQVIENKTGNTLTVSTPGFNATYKWKFGTVSGTYGNTIANVTSSTYTISGSDFGMPGTYYLIAEATSVCNSQNGTQLVEKSAEIVVTVLAGTSALSFIEATSSEAITISSLTNGTIASNTDGVQVWGLKLYDGNGNTDDSDNLPTSYTSFTVKPGTANTIDWANAINKVEFFLGNATTPMVGSPVISSTGIAFTPTTPITVADGPGSFASISMRLTLKTSLPSAADNAIIQFSLAKVDVVTATDATSSQLAGFSAVTSNATKNKVAVIATKITFNPAPVSGTVNVNLPSFTIAATDINNNTDTDFGGCNVALTTTGTGFTSSNTYAISSGLATISDVNYSVIQNNITLTATAQTCLSNSSVTSSAFNITDIAYAIGDFRTTGVNNYGTTSTSNWEKYSLVNGALTWVPAQIPSANTSATLFIQHTVTVNGAVTPANVTIVNAGKLLVNSQISISGKLQVKDKGVLELTDERLFLTNASFEVEDGGTVILNAPNMTSAKSFWAGTEKFGSNSTFIIKSWDTGAGSGGDKIYNVVSNVPNISLNSDGYVFGNLTIEMGASAFTLINGTNNLKFIKNNLVISNSTSTITINNNTSQLEIGNVQVNSGTLRLFTSSGSPVLNVPGNFEVNSGSINFNGTNTAGGTNTLNIGGNLKVVPTTSTTITSTDGGSILNLNGTAPQQVDIASGVSTANVSLYVKNAAKVILANRNLVINSTLLNVENGATLDFNGFNITGTGSFILADGGTLNITDVAGIIAPGTAVGNVQTTSRTFGNSKYIYGGALAQNTGTGLPANIQEIIINNPAGVTLSTSSEATTLTLNHGRFKTSQTSKVTISANGTVDAPELTSFVDGPLAFKVSAPKLLKFPIGKGNNSRPLELNILSHDAIENIYTAEQFDKAYVTQDTAMASGVKNISKIRYFSILKSGTAAVQATVQLTYAADDAVTEPNKLTIVKYNNGTNPVNLTAITSVNAAGGTILSGDFTSFSDFMLGNLKTGTNPLPVELITFTAKPQGNSALLNWATASETNSATFEIERSLNGTNFERGGSIQAAGNSNVEKRYAFTDKNPNANLVYYRLKQIDLDGTFAYSEIQSVRFNGLASEIALYPNPANDAITLAFGQEKSGVIQVVNNLGQVVLERTVSKLTEKVLNVTALPVGVYQVIISDQQTTSVKRFVKVN